MIKKRGNASALTVKRRLLLTVPSVMLVEQRSVIALVAG
jgi:hypothetical protein